jgi:hypothetical protein
MSEAQPQPVQDDFTAVWLTVLAGVVCGYLSRRKRILPTPNSRSKVA